MDFGTEFAKIAVGAILGYFTGRATKNRDLMQADLTDRTKELREAIGKICEGAAAYWENSQATTTPGTGRDLNRKLHLMQKLRVHCAGAGSGYRTEYIRDLETRLFDAVSGGGFESPTRLAELDRVQRIRDVADDLDYAVMGARRADLFLIPYDQLRQLYLRITHQG